MMKWQQAAYKSRPQALLNRLPIEILRSVLSRLDPSSLFQLRSVCRQWMSLVHDSSLWRQVAIRHGLVHDFIVSHLSDSEKDFVSWVHRIMKYYHIRSTIFNLFTSQTDEDSIHQAPPFRTLVHMTELQDLLGDGAGSLHQILCSENRLIWHATTIIVLCAVSLQQLKLINIGSSIDAIHLLPPTPPYTDRSYLLVLIHPQSHIILYDLTTFTRIQIASFPPPHLRIDPHLRFNLHASITEPSYISLAFLANSPLNLLIRLTTWYGMVSMAVTLDDADGYPTITQIPSRWAWSDCIPISGDWTGAWFLHLPNLSMDFTEQWMGEENTTQIGLCVNRFGVVAVAPVQSLGHPKLWHGRLEQRDIREHMTAVKMCTSGYHAGTLVTGWENGTIACYKITSKKLNSNISNIQPSWSRSGAHRNTVTAVDVHWDASFFVSVSWDKSVKVWNLVTGQLQSMLLMSSPCTALVLRIDDEDAHIVIGKQDSSVESFHIHLRSDKKSNNLISTPRQRYMPNPIMEWIQNIDV